MAFTTADLDAIDKRIASAETRIKHGDRDITYADIDSLKARRDLIASEIAQANGKKRARSWKLYQSGRGF